MRVQPEARSSRGTILVIRLDQIGDVILTYPFLEALKTLRPGDRLVLVTNPSLVDFAEATSPADDVLAFDPGESLFKRSGIRRQAAAMRFAARLRRRLGKIDLALVPRRGLDYLHATQLAALCRPGQLVGFGAAHEEPTQGLSGIAIAPRPEGRHHAGNPGVPAAVRTPEGARPRDRTSVPSPRTPREHLRSGRNALGPRRRRPHESRPDRRSGASPPMLASGAIRGSARRKPVHRCP